MGRSVGRKGIGGFKTHRKNLSLTGSENSSIGQGNHIPVSDTQPIPTTKIPITPQFLNEIEGLLDKVAHLVQEDTAHLIEKVKSLRLYG